MMRAGVFALVSVASLAVATAACVCTDLRFEMTGITPTAIAQEMVGEATSIEVMRVTGRRVASKPDPLYIEYYELPYFYTLESVDAISGESRGSFEVAGFEDGWLERRFGSSPFARVLNREPLWWLTPEGYGELYRTVILHPGDQSSIACASPLTFTVGIELLPFRGDDGVLLDSRQVRGPILERLYGENDPWLLEVRQAIASTPRVSRSPSWFDWLFAAIYGSGLTPAKTF